MKFKEFRQTNCFKEANMIFYRDPDGKVVELPYRKMKNKEVVAWSFIPNKSNNIKMLFVTIKP